MDYLLLGQRIKAARLSLGLTQNQLAEKVGVTSQHISHTECATTKIALPVLVNISNSLGTSIDKLLYDSIYDSKPYLLDDIQTLFTDCNPDEIYVMLQAASSVKQAMRTRKLSREIL